MRNKVLWISIGILLALTMALASCKSTPRTTTTTSATTPLQPADHAGRTGCLVCHNDLPADHANRADTTCAACHPLAP
ncbi:MAG: hypothetical protein NTX46_05250 [Chloroflexi bacterium]|nr:hypothetical protein [Chloroflexota bacterium]